MTAWIGFVPVVLVATLVVFVPGLAVSAGLRLRGPLLWGFAPAAGIAALSASAIVAPYLGQRWNPLTAGLCCLVLAAFAWLFGFMTRPRPAVEDRPVVGGAVYLAVLAGAAMSASRVAAMIGDPVNISQSNDAVFHLNALRWIEETGSASSLTVSGVLGAHSFYPAAWHGIASLTSQLAGVDAAHAANAVSLAIAGPVWAASISALTWSVTGGSRRATMLAALFSVGLFAFPSLVLDFGVLYPYALAVAILPGVIAVLAAQRRSSTRFAGAKADEHNRRRIGRGLLLLATTLVGLLGIALSQPAVLLVWLIAALILGAEAALRRWRGSSRRGRAGLLVIGLATVIVAMAVWTFLSRQTSGVQWGALEPNYQAVGELLINNPIGRGAAFALSALALVGTVVAVRRPTLRWLPVLALALAALAFAALAMNNMTVRTALLSAWYGDPYRFVALMPVAVLPLAAVGADAVVARLARSERVGPGSVRALTTLIVAVVILEAAAWAVVQRLHGEDLYADDRTSFLSADERALLTALPKYVSPDSVVLGNPSTGAAYGYALSGRNVVPRTWLMPSDPTFQELRFHLVDVAKDPDVCSAINTMNVDYVLDFGPGAEAPGRYVMPGMTGYANAAGFELVAQRGDASLWRVTACAH